MLVIRRRAGEAILIGDTIEIEVLDLTSSHVKVGIRAPREILVLRKEIRLVAEENVRAARDVPAAGLAKIIAALAKPRSDQTG